MRKYALVGFVLFGIIVLSGCLQNPRDYETHVINASLQFAPKTSCTCMLCTNGTESKILNLFTTGLDGGTCFFKDNCTRDYLYNYLTYNKNNYVREFLIGQGATYTEYEQANLRCNLQEGYVVRVLYSKGRAPLYDRKTFFGVVDSAEGDAVECALRKGAIPIYIIYTEGTYYGTEWIGDFINQTFTDKLYPTAPVYIAPEALFNESNVGDITKEIDAIYTACTKKSADEKYCIEVNPDTRECTKYDPQKVRGCRVALFPKQDSDEEIFKILDEVNKSGRMSNVSAIILTINVDNDKYACDGGLAIRDITNRSRYILNRYGKPSFLIFSIDKSCTSSASNITLDFYSAIPIMRMTGIFGAAYSEYTPYEGNPLNNKTDAYSIATMEDWFKLCQYYTNTTPYKKEPVIFQSNGVNITQECDYLTDNPMLTFLYDQAELNKINAYNVQPKKLEKDYEPCISEIEFGDISKIADGWKESGGTSEDKSTQATYSKDVCLNDYPDVEILAERCGISRHLVRAFNDYGITLNKCSDWYDVEEELDKAKIINRAEIKPGGDYETQLGKVAFFYVLKKSSLQIYEKVIQSSEYGATIASNPVSICNGIEWGGTSGEKQKGEKQTIKDDTPCRVLKKYEEYKEQCDLGKMIEEINENSKQKAS